MERDSERSPAWRPTLPRRSAPGRNIRPALRSSLGNGRRRIIAGGAESPVPQATENDGCRLHLPGDEKRVAVGYASDMGRRSFGKLWASIDRDPAFTDAAIALLLAALASIWLWLQWPPERLPAIPVVAGFGLLQCLPLAWRRRFPLPVLAVVTVGTVLYGLAGGAETPWAANAWLLAAFSAGAYGGDRWRNRVLTLATATFVGYVAYEVFWGLPTVDPIEPAARLILFQLFALIGNVGFVVWVLWLGEATRIRREREAQLAERTDQLEREREANSRRAVLDERVRIAREVHDVVAHHVSVMGIQAGAARRVLAQRPAKAEEMLKAIEASGRDAVREMHRLLGFLRQDRDEDALSPQPGMRRLDALIEQMRAAGLPVELRIEGAQRPLPAGIDLSAYRIVQEALTNALKHAGPATAAATIRYRDDALEIEISDDGATPRRDRPAGGGSGLIGMRERAGLHGGWLRVERNPRAGFVVRAHLPFDAGPP